MTLIRSLIFNLFYYSWTAVLSCMLPLAVLLSTHRGVQSIVAAWGHGTNFFLRWIIGLKVCIEGLENLPKGPYMIAAKHQSAWDTLIFHTVLPDPVFVIKKELMSIPFWGMGFRKTGAIPVDRSGGAKALKDMVAGITRALDLGRQVIIFPEGTRTRPGQTLPYHPGVAAAYKAVGVPVVPVALNSGMFWGRRDLKKYGGTVTLTFLPSIPPGVDRKKFQAKLVNDVEQTSQQLMRVAADNDPTLPGAGDLKAAVPETDEPNETSGSVDSGDKVQKPS